MMELQEALCRERAQLKAERSQVRKQRKRLERSPDPSAPAQLRQLEEQERWLRARRRGLKRLLYALSLSSAPETSPQAPLSASDELGELLVLAHQQLERALALCSLSGSVLDGPVRALSEPMDEAQRLDCCEQLKRAKQALRTHRKKSEPGGGDSLRRQPEGCEPGMARNNLGEQAERPIDKKLGEQAKRPMDKKWGEQAKCPIDKKLGEQAKRPMDKKLENGDAKRLKALERQLRAWRKVLESSPGGEASRTRAATATEENAQQPSQRRESKQRLCKLEPERRAELCADLGADFRCEKCGLSGPERFLCRPRPK